MNLKIKFRESFRPFAPVVLQERASDFFKFDQDVDSPYMLLVTTVQDSVQCELHEEEKQLDGLDKLRVPRSKIPAVTHVDNSARVQTVDEERHGLIYHLMQCFEEETACPVMINTSFNVRGEPIVCTPEEAYRCFMATNMDVLVIGPFVLLKDEQPESHKIDRQQYLDQYELD